MVAQFMTHLKSRPERVTQSTVGPTFSVTLNQLAEQNTILLTPFRFGPLPLLKG
jgi:hypothetical protein